MADIWKKIVGGTRDAAVQTKLTALKTAKLTEISVIKEKIKGKKQEYGLKVFDLLGEQGVASEAAMAIYAEFHQKIQEFEKLMAKRKEEIDAIIAEEKTLFKH